MSIDRLKGMNKMELRQFQKETVAFIERFESNLATYRARLSLINTEVYNRAAKRMTLAQIENLLGHKVILEDE